MTVGDVAARAGVKISEAEEALNALAADAGGTLEVSTEPSPAQMKRVVQYSHPVPPCQVIVSGQPFKIA